VKFKKRKEIRNNIYYSWESQKESFLIGGYLCKNKDPEKKKWTIYHYGIEGGASCVLGYANTISEANDKFNLVYCLGKYKYSFDIPTLPLY